MRHIFYVFFAVCVTIFTGQANLSADHGVSTWGNLKYGPNFTQFDYTTPDAVDGGEIVLGALGTFDSVNPYIVKGTPAVGTPELFATLLAPSYDEINAGYAYVAKDILVSKDGLSVRFTINENATFNNGEKITAEDVAFSFERLKKEGLPVFATYYKDVKNVRVEGDHVIIFELSNSKNRELPLILGQIPVFSKKYYEQHAFGETTLTPSPSSGPYEVAEIKPGQSIVYKKVKNWWGANVPSQRGHYHFEQQKYLYFRDMNALFEAFKAGQIHVRFENSAKFWHTAYTFDAVKDGRVIRETIQHKMCPGTYGLFFNTRRPLFKDINVRKAITLMLNFEWLNKNILFGDYKRNLSFFPNTVFEGNKEATRDETALLDELHQKFPDISVENENLETVFTLPEYKNDADLRRNIKEALMLLEKAGWTLNGQKLLNKSGDHFQFELMIYDKSFERILAPFVENLKRIGVHANLRFVDVSSYQERLDDTDFDMILGILGASNSPGNELRDYFSSASISQKGTRNQWGIQDPRIDALIEDIITSPTYDYLSMRMRVLDRLLLKGYYMIPAWHTDKINVAYWNMLEKPTNTPQYMPLSIDTWWMRGDQKQIVNKGNPKMTEKEDSSPQTFDDKPVDAHENATKRSFWEHIFEGIINVISRLFH